MLPSASDQAQALLLKASSAYRLPLGRDEVQRAVEDPEHGPALVDWASSHLASDTLLTVDELALYEALDKSGQVEQLTSRHELAELLPLYEEDLNAAIDDLQRSTDLVSKQTENLRQQQGALSRLEANRSRQVLRRGQVDEESHRKALVDKAQLANEVEVLSQHLRLAISELEEQARASESRLRDMVIEMLQSHDQLLLGHQKLGRELAQPDAEELQTVERIREDCARLIKTTVETIRARLDTVYLNSLVASREARAAESAATAATQDQVEAVQEELESFYSEILPVASMSIEPIYLEPVTRLVLSEKSRRVQRNTAALTYVSSCLDCLIDALDAVKTRAETLWWHQSALESISATARAEMDSERPSALDTVAQVAPSPVHKDGASPSHGRRRLAENLPEESTALENLFQSLGLSAPSTHRGYGHQEATELARELAARQKKVADVRCGAQETLESAATKQLHDARRAVQLAQDSLLAETPFGEVRLADDEVEGSITILMQEVDNAKQRLAELAEAQKRVAGSRKRAEIVDRWTS